MKYLKPTPEQTNIFSELLKQEKTLVGICKEMNIGYGTARYWKKKLYSEEVTPKKIIRFIKPIDLSKFILPEKIERPKAQYSNHSSMGIAY